ncbi:lysine N(6)-hydroxylase/L-ornithine N(5)-oxygenase family protein [Lentzea tibetensis]|uniref:L-lysine N6-monooxygenase MbtG n=1 Tax=Lentzea tibetensis TaxID=2591470 RepID=A0A563EZ79_9PSEU|nr:lysine N(6)-hydroxylase/L-ornithine N(5)-oxygenase family protein [Lentzea tibetensis]TWP52434.1 lysine N(6)-hydroxylase/L-ornithine N(5)-oxygenase family protein [Lentzea tibetensis]
MVPIYDLVGIGFGPSNLALAIALTEHNEHAETPVTAVFLERQQTFGWHRGMLLEDATMQVSFLKDLVTMRNPVSRFSFLCYLQERGRLIDFVNHKNLFPLRVEFHDYFEWAAAQVDDLVAYESDVVSVSALADDLFEVVTASGERYRARNLVFATGLVPEVPDGVALSDHVWHNSQLLHRVSSLTAPKRVVVVGAGQSAAEAVAYLHREFPAAEVCSVFSRYGFSPADDSSFANRIFDPAAVDTYYSSPDAFKERLMAYHRNTNYSVVDTDLIDQLYRTAYREKVLGRERLRFLNVCRLDAVTETGTGARAVVRSLATGALEVLDADVVVLATGYREADPTRLLGSLAATCTRDDAGRFAVARDYRLVTSLRGGLYLQGGTEHTHGITSSLLSNVAVRSGEILDSVLTNTTSRVLASA